MRKFLLIILCIGALTACREYQPSSDPGAKLAFSCDTLCFDTVLTEQGSVTLQLMVYNPNKESVIIDRVWLDDGEAFKVNIDGEQDLSRLSDLPIYGGDSLFVFVRVADFGATGVNDAVLIEDRLHFHLQTGSTQSVILEAYSQDAERLGIKGGRQQYRTYHFTADKPYLLFDTVIVTGNVTIDAGTTIYMHNGAALYIGGNMTAIGTHAEPITIRGDRLDRLFDSVPYLYAAGSWDGIYLQTDVPRTYHLQYVDILSGNVGLYAYSTCSGRLPKLAMNGCRIHNHSLYGLVLVNTDATVVNTEISNCASYCVYCSGGTHDFIHSTIASYFGYTTIHVQSVAKEDAAAVFIDNLQKTGPKTTSSFYNSIITGYQKNQLVVATPFDQYYPGIFLGNYLKTDSLRIPHAQENIYWQKSDTNAVFRNDFYEYKKYVYYDFRLDSLSPAIGIGDSIAALPYSTDRNGISRSMQKPDAGCYQHE
ncbi:MAG: hypothetical protein IJ814_03870 [Paludibacteraceae bacterium]|nr:hypothetical protein [Paludibacteraceae bacterium]